MKRYLVSNREYLSAFFAFTYAFVLMVLFVENMDYLAIGSLVGLTASGISIYAFISAIIPAEQITVGQLYYNTYDSESASSDKARSVFYGYLGVSLSLFPRMFDLLANESGLILSGVVTGLCVVVSLLIVLRLLK